MIRDLAAVTDQEVRRDQSLCAFELALPAVDLPDHGPVPEPGVGTAVEMTAAHRAEVQPVLQAEGDRSGLEESSVVLELDFRL